jgi:hypothetical protein
MGRKRLKIRLKRRRTRYRTKGKSKGRLQKERDNPFDSLWFWMNLAMTDLSGFFAIKADPKRSQRRALK